MWRSTTIALAPRFSWLLQWSSKRPKFAARGFNVSPPHAQCPRLVLACWKVPGALAIS